MDTTNNQSLNVSLREERGKDIEILHYIIRKIEKGTGLSFDELKTKYSEEQLFFEGLKHITTTKKAFCEALRIPVEAGCRYKRGLEKMNRLVQSETEVTCPYTKHKAHLISTNPNEFEKLRKTNQLTMF